MNQKSALLVPIHIDILKLDTDKSVLPPMADFSLLPYQVKDKEGNQYDKNPDTAYLSESVALEPFSNLNLTLKKGVHLHWAMPNGLTKAPKDNDIFGTEQTFPAVPNRWLIKRSDGKKWVIESDYLYPLDKTPKLPHVAVPMPSVIKEDGEEKVNATPFRYMGRVIPLEDWKKSQKGDEYWSDYYQQPLTAVGYGEPTFASYFPNCYTVFGFYDDTPLKNGSYEVIGWYEQTSGYEHHPDYYHLLKKQFDNNPLVLHKEVLIRQYQRNGRIEWNNSIKKGTIQPTEGKVRADIATPKTDKEKFLTPSPTVSVDSKLEELIQHCWSEIEGNSATKIVASKEVVTLSTEEIDFSKTTYIKDYLETALSDFFDINKHLSLLEKEEDIKTIGNFSPKQIWNQLTKKQWIVPLSASPKFAAIMPLKKRKPLDSAYLPYQNDLKTILKGKPKFISKTQLRSRFITYFNSQHNTCLVPKQRLKNRYGEDEGDKVWTYLMKYPDKFQLLHFTDSHAFLAKPVMLKLSDFPDDATLKNFDLLAKDISTGKLLNPSGHFTFVSKEDFISRFEVSDWEKIYKENKIEPTVGIQNGNTVTKHQFIAKQVKIADEIWQAQIASGYFIPTEGLVNTSVIGQPLPIPKDVANDIHAIVYTIQKKDVVTEFGDKDADDIWKDLISDQWVTLLPDSHTKATININNVGRKTLSGKGKMYQRRLEKLLSPKDRKIDKLVKPIKRILYQVTKATFTNEFGLEKGTQLWQELLAKTWLVKEDKDQVHAFINNARHRKDLDKKIDIALEDILAIVQPKMYRQIFVDNFGTKGNSIWQMLVEDNWVLPNKETATEAIILKAADAENSVDFAKYTYRTALQEMLRRKLKWHIDISVDNLFEVKKAQSIPDQALFAGKATLTETSSKKNEALTSNDTHTITIANTGVEAISAYLSHQKTVTDANTTENTLEAIQFGRKLKGLKVDLPATLQEMRHEAEFTSHLGGIIWTIKTKQSNEQVSPDIREELVLSDGLAKTLNQLNTLQKQYEKYHHQIISLRRQLYTDWYKYMISIYPPQDSGLYPDIDEVKYFIELVDLRAIRKLMEATGELKVIGSQHDITAALGHFVDIEADGWDYSQLKVVEHLDHYTAALLREDAAYRELTQADQVAEQVLRVLKELQLFNDQQLEKASPKDYTLGWIPGPRFWEPKEPVIMITGDSALQTNRYGAKSTERIDNLLDCPIINLSISLPITRKNVDDLTSIKVKFEKVCDEQPWHPMMIEWDANFIAVNDPTSIGAKPRGYDTNFISSQYDLPEESPQYQVKAGEGKLLGNQSRYSGFSLLTPSMVVGYEKRLSTYLDNYKVDKTKENIGEIEGSQELKKVLQTALNAYRKLENIKDKSLAQHLSGFNAGLLQQRKTLQFKVADPLNFEEYQGFTNRIRKYIGKYNTAAPMPLNDFNPLRAGSLEITQLRLIDTFGQVKELETKDFYTTTQLKARYNTHSVNLPPRIVQPARLNLRWLSSNHDKMEMNTHPATTPICGWVVLNKLDDGLMIYDNDGNYIGIINEDAKWTAPPGHPFIPVKDISNIHLQNMVNYILKKSQIKDSTFLKDFITMADNALENIHPEYFSEHQDLALLMSRPMALVRVSVGLELDGLPATNHSWDSFRQDLDKALRSDLPTYQTDEIPAYVEKIRETYNFENVKFPIRIGDYRQLNDGIIGYWKPKAEQYLETDFGGTIGEDDLLFMPQTTLPETSNLDKNIINGVSETLKIHLTLHQPTMHLPLLIDPTGSLHATSGILPVKEIDIPADQYKAILRKIQVTFLAAPVITPKDKIRMPLPQEPNFEWSWLQKLGNNWVESPTISKADFTIGWSTISGETFWDKLNQSFYKKEGKTLEEFHQEVFPNLSTDQWKLRTAFLETNQLATTSARPMARQQFIHLWSKEAFAQQEANALWQYLYNAKWLSPLEHHARVVAEKQRGTAIFDPPWTGYEEQVSDVLSLYQWTFAPPELNGAFSNTQRIVEGYLKLKSL